MPTMRTSTNHPTVQLTEQKSRGREKFDFQEVNPTQVKECWSL